jgi:hypothetical protein
MDVGRALERVARAGRAVAIRTGQALSRTSAFLAAVMELLARRSERMAVRLHAAHGHLVRSSQALQARALAADLADEGWEEPELLPLAPVPPPIPPAALLGIKPAARNQDWAAAIAAAKRNH